VRILEEWSLLV